MDKILVVMAAGLGSRYGGVKQIERLGPGDEILMEYAIYDALKAGFNRIVLILKPEIYDDVKELFGDRIERSTGIKIDYAMQTNDRFTEARPTLSGRAKPFGTVHAVLCAKEYIDAPFAVINADDYYGSEALCAMSDILPALKGAQDSAMVAYLLKNTVSSFGSVTRGICEAENGFLSKVKETYGIRLMPDGGIVDGNGTPLSPDSLVSMNIWGYHPNILAVMEQYFSNFLLALPEDDCKAECLLPTMMDELIGSGKTNTAALSTTGKWFGITYREDKPGAQEALLKLHAEGVYPDTLWGGKFFG